MAPSWVSTSISKFLKSQKAFLLALEPLRQISADLSKAKDVLALIHEIVIILLLSLLLYIIVVYFFSFTYFYLVYTNLFLLSKWIVSLK